MRAASIPASDISPELDTNPGGVYLRGIRLREEMTQEDLAKRTGIPRANISAKEHGKPRGATLKKVAEALGIPAAPISCTICNH